VKQLFDAPYKRVCPRSQALEEKDKFMGNFINVQRPGFSLANEAVNHIIMQILEGHEENASGNGIASDDYRISADVNVQPKSLSERCLLLLEILTNDEAMTAARRLKGEQREKKEKRTREKVECEPKKGSDDSWEDGRPTGKEEKLISSVEGCVIISTPLENWILRFNRYTYLVLNFYINVFKISSSVFMHKMGTFEHVGQKWPQACGLYHSGKPSMNQLNYFLWLSVNLKALPFRSKDVYCRECPTHALPCGGVLPIEYQNNGVLRFMDNHRK
jgi:hypothetical protein